MRFCNHDPCEASAIYVQLIFSPQPKNPRQNIFTQLFHHKCFCIFGDFTPPYSNGTNNKLGRQFAWDRYRKFLSVQGIFCCKVLNRVKQYETRRSRTENVGHGQQGWNKIGSELGSIHTAGVWWRNLFCFIPSCVEPCGDNNTLRSTFPGKEQQHP